jgi:hypothetical protein
MEIDGKSGYDIEDEGILRRNLVWRSMMKSGKNSSGPD